MDFMIDALNTLVRSKSYFYFLILLSITVCLSTVTYAEKMSTNHYFMRNQRSAYGTQATVEE